MLVDVEEDVSPQKSVSLTVFLVYTDSLSAGPSCGTRDAIEQTAENGTMNTVWTSH